MIALLLIRKELLFWFKRPGVHAFFALFFLLGVLTMGSIGGSVEFIQLGGFGGQLKADSPMVIVSITMAFALFATMNIAAAGAGAATRDVSDGMHTLVYSTQVSRIELLLPRFLGALAVSTYLVLASAIGLYLGTILPWLEAERVGASNFAGTVLSLLIWLGPNVLFTTALFFAIGCFTRRMFPAYIGGVLLFVGYLAASAFSDLDNRAIGVLLDPFGSAALADLSRYWSPVEENTLLPIPTGFGLVNRILWTSIGFVALGMALFLTPLDEKGWQPFARFQRPERAPADPDPDAVHRPVPAVTQHFGTAARLSQLGALTRRSVTGVLGHRYFWAFIGAALLFELLNAQNIGRMYGTHTYPVTYAVLSALSGSIGLFLVVIIVFYAGDLVWQDRERGSDQLIDCTPIPDLLPLLARTVALTAVVVGLHTTVLVVGVLVQLWDGYTNFELGQYLEYLYIHSMLEWIPFIFLAIAVHVVVNQKMVGHILVVGFFVAMLFRTSWGFELNLPWFGSDPGKTYSDMTGWGFSRGPFFAYKAYWLCAASLFLVAAKLAWVRGTSLGWSSRLREARRRLDRPTLVLAGTLTALFLGIGATLGYQTVGVGEYQNSVQSKRDAADYEKRFKAEWERAPHPEITDVKLEVDLHPSLGRADVRGTFQLVNPHEVPIERMVVAFPDEDDVVSWTLPGVTETRDEALELRLWTLDPPLQPGATTRLEFVVAYGDRGLPNSGYETNVVPNGTFLHSSDVFPMFGYQDAGELSDPADRRKYDLPERPRMRDLDDPIAREHHYLTDDAQHVTFEVKLSTEPGQRPLAPGSVVDEGAENGRPWIRYRANRPIHHFFAFVSGDYTIAKRDDGPVAVEVWHHGPHAYNVDRMLQAMVDSLKMFETDYAPFQHDILRIVEFPRYATYAQSFPTMIPFSEAIGFIASIEDPEEDIDYVYYVTAHEVAHQWWAHQIIAGNGQGATLLSESLSQYSSLRVMEAEYGTEHIDRFLHHEADRYFSARSGERDEELPLMRVYADQGYIHYQKGGIILYALSERVGRSNFDDALRTFLEARAFADAPYPTARDFVDHLHATFPAHRMAIEDGLERIVLYDLRVEEPKVRESWHDWTLFLDPTVRKLSMTGAGAETEEPFDDELEVLITDVDGNEIRQTHRFGQGPVQIVVKNEPVTIQLDPRGLFLDRDRDDNKAAVVPE